MYTVTDTQRLLDISNGLHQNNIKLLRHKNGERNVPDFNRPAKEGEKNGHDRNGTSV